jgi:hypothetical protein
MLNILIARRTIFAITYDFTDTPESQLTSVRAVGKGKPYFLVNFEIQLQLKTDDQLQLETNAEIILTCNGNEMKRMTINYQ